MAHRTSKSSKSKSARKKTAKPKTKRKRKSKTTTGSKPGSGKNFKSLSRSLAKKGAKNPGALAAWIGRRKYGNKGYAKLSSAGRRRGRGK